MKKTKKLNTWVWAEDPLRPPSIPSLMEKKSSEEAVPTTSKQSSVKKLPAITTRERRPLWELAGKKEEEAKQKKASIEARKTEEKFKRDLLARQKKLEYKQWRDLHLLDYWQQKERQEKESLERRQQEKKVRQERELAAAALLEKKEGIRLIYTGSDWIRPPCVPGDPFLTGNKESRQPIDQHRQPYFLPPIKEEANAAAPGTSSATFNKTNWPFFLPKPPPRT
ncbi:uncharacterized protein LOC134299212 [Anolis carolinensis]|uniref:uncharacterized protein LOC134299212 n=1 Tax=Anolis carolinensis TaxID=28377 RepID=UPI002F2B28C5